MIRTSLPALVAILLLTLVGRAPAAIVGFGGEVMLIPPPPSVFPFDLPEPWISAFDEVQDYTLINDLEVNIMGDGHYASLASLTGGTIPAGTAVHSHFLHLRMPLIRKEGWVEFDQPILGVIVLTEELDNSDGELGWPGTLYPTPSPSVHPCRDARGADWYPGPPPDPAEWFTVSGNRLDLSLFVSNCVDQVRVVTAVPEPAVSCWGALAVTGIALLRRKRFTG